MLDKRLTTFLQYVEEEIPKDLPCRKHIELFEPVLDELVTRSREGERYLWRSTELLQHAGKMVPSRAGSFQRTLERRIPLALLSEQVGALLSALSFMRVLSHDYSVG